MEPINKELDGYFIQLNNAEEVSLLQNTLKKIAEKVIMEILALINCITIE